MTDLDTRLQQALEADAPLPRDPMFRIAVLMRRERAAFRRKLLIGAATTLGAGVLALLVFGAAAQLVGVGPARLAAAAVGVALLTAILAALYADALTPLGRWRARAPGFVLWR